MNPKLKLLILSALSVSALNLFAQNFVVTSDTTISDTHYENKATGTAASGNGQDGARFTAGGTLNLTSGTINANRYGIYLSNTSAATVNDTTIITSANTGYGIYLANSNNTLILTGGTITTTGTTARGIYVTNQSAATVTDATISTHGDNAAGLYTTGTSTLTVTDGTITTTSGTAYGIYVINQSTATGTNITISTSGYNSNGITVTGTSALALTDGTITTTGTIARGIFVNQQSTATVTGVTISTFGDRSNGLYVTGTSTLTVTGGTIATTSSNAAGIYVINQSIATGTNITILTGGYNSNGITVTNTSALTLNGGNIVTAGYASNGMTVTEAATARVSDLAVETNGYLAYGFVISSGGADAESASTGIFERVQVLTRGDDSYGMRIGAGIITGNTTAYSNAELIDSTITTEGRGATGVVMYSPTGYTSNTRLVLDHTTVTAAQGHALAVGDDGDRLKNFTSDSLDFADSDPTYELIISNGTELNPGDGKHAIIVDSKITGTHAGDPTIITGTEGRMVLTAEVDDSAVNGSVSIQTSATATLNLTHSTLTGDILANENVTLALTGSADTVITGDVISSGSANTSLNLDHSTLTGDVTASDNSQLTLTASNGATISGNVTGNDDTTITLAISGSDTTLSGTITGNNNSTLAVTVSDNGTLAGEVTASDNSSLTLGINEDSTVIGSITGTGSSTLDITVSDSGTLAGNITTSEDNNTTVTISDGGAITGDLTGSDNSTLAVTVDNGGTLTGALNGEQVTVTVDSGGNVTINQDSDFNSLANSGNVTVDTGSVIITNPITGNGTTTINDSGNLTASFDGGNGSLVINPGGSVNLTQDSNLGTISNDGTLNIGDYQVSVSDLANNGTIDIAVNTDSGAHGTLHVTGTSSGAGTIHVTSTGDGQANPNDILGNLVTGNGTANYTWDEVDWGLEEFIVTPNPDGTISIKEDGTSPAGAVLNSAIAVQQSLWFAQQNSLLKRMGDLRYGARASRPQADKDVRVPYNSLIENIWIRSYGQQLNVGSQVAGKAYEQLIYGVDLGTDHKFTISADSDLYLGVFAGYGRSDLDYRTPGADGEINSYYGGLYATWLHSSGFYIDATVKAASVDNDLKAPYGSTQLKASYSDVNLGGSLEIGKKFTFSDAWFIEPQFQVNYLHILAEDYSAAPLTIKAQDLDALQLRLGSLFGRTINLTNSGALQPYIKVSGVETISSGGTLRNGYQHTRANTDGARAELGAGLIWQLDADNQLHLDYEASFGDKYDKPWGLSAGYRHQF